MEREAVFGVIWVRVWVVMNMNVGFWERWRVLEGLRDSCMVTRGLIQVLRNDFFLKIYMIEF